MQLNKEETSVVATTRIVSLENRYFIYSINFLSNKQIKVQCRFCSTICFSKNRWFIYIICLLKLPYLIDSSFTSNNTRTRGKDEHLVWRIPGVKTSRVFFSRRPGHAQDIFLSWGTLKKPRKKEKEYQTGQRQRRGKKKGVERWKHPIWSLLDHERCFTGQWIEPPTCFDFLSK